MNTYKHTSGPWHIGALDNGDILGPLERSCSPVICKMPVWWQGKQPGEHVSQDLQRANARLIAAAPEMAEALREMISAMWQHFEYHHDGEDDCGSENCQRALDKARAAIAKAIVE